MLKDDVLVAVGADAALTAGHVEEKGAGHGTAHVLGHQLDVLLAQDGVDALNIPLADIAQVAVFVIRLREAPWASICRRVSRMPVSAYFRGFFRPASMFSGSITWSRAPRFRRGSWKHRPMQEPNA